jgi:LPS export ABC transporter protein LptC
MGKNRSSLLYRDFDLHHKWPILLLCILFLFTIIISSCSLDYSSAHIAEDLSETIPETEFIDFSQVQVRNNKITTKIEASLAESYTKKKEMVLKDLWYKEFDETGELITEGKADKAVFNTETEDADMFGNIYFYSYTEKTAIFADTLYWKNKEEKLIAEPDEKVIVKKDDGSYIEGKGFETDFRLKEIIFKKSVKGSYTD